MNLKESIIQILSDKKAKQKGLHVKHIARHIYNNSNTLFSEGIENDFNVFKKKVNRILADDVKKKRGGVFKRIIHPGNGKFRRGYYKLK